MAHGPGRRGARLTAQIRNRRGSRLGDGRGSDEWARRGSRIMWAQLTARTGMARLMAYIN
uniref:Uncharacterized protein n=1 Tax=Cucumis melo TaxID=3656 RepID=A0A9I9DFP5_CUCME